jgi:hypothetical protein
MPAVKIFAFLDLAQNCSFLNQKLNKLIFSHKKTQFYLPVGFRTYLAGYFLLGVPVKIPARHGQRLSVAGGVVRLA